MTTVQLKSGHTATEVEDDMRQKVEKFFEGHQSGVVRLSPDDWILPKNYLKFADKIYTFKYKKDDVVVMTWPKCGTTWMQEIIWTMRNNPNLDNPKGDRPVNVRCPFIDFDMLLPPPPPEPVPMEGSPLETLMEAFNERCPGKDPRDGIFIQLSENLEEPRTMKIHVPFSLTNPELVWKAKVVIVVRNPKDVCVSYHHHTRLFHVHGFKGDLDDFVDFFVKDELYYSPYWTYMKELLAKKNHPNVHLVFYEKLKANPEAEMHRLDKFLGTNLTKDQLKKIIEYTSFESMKDRDNLVHPKTEGEISKLFNEEVVKEDGDFFRQGEAGGYKKKLTEEQEAKIDDWTKKNSGGLEREMIYSA